MAWYKMRREGSGGGVQPVGDATDGDVLSGKTYMNVNGASTGTMTNNGAVSPSGLDCGESYTIPEGYHNGNGTVTANSLASQTGVDSGKTAVVAGAMLSGYQGWVTGSKISGNIASKAAATYNTSTSDQTIASGQYLSGAQTIKAVTTANISAANVKYNVNVKVGDANSATRIANVTGTFTKSGTQSSGQTVAAAGQIITGYSAWVNGAEVKGSFTGQEKSTTPTTRSATAATVTPDSGKYLTKVTVNTNSVPNSNSGTKTITSSDTNWYTGNVDMGATNTYRYVNAVAVYNKGKEDGSSIDYIGVGTTSTLDKDGARGQQLSLGSLNVSNYSKILWVYACGNNAGYQVDGAAPTVYASSATITKQLTSGIVVSCITTGTTSATVLRTITNSFAGSNVLHIFGMK